MLSKYHNLPNHFHDLLFKKATSKNVQNIQEVVQSQQQYTTVLFGHINTLYTKLAQPDKQAQIHCIYPHPQSDVIQLNAPDYDLDIDREPAPTIDEQSPNAESATSIPGDCTAIPLPTNRPKHQSSEESANTDCTEDDSSKQTRAEHHSNYHPKLEDIPELETDEENWDDGQFEVEDQEYSPYHITQGVK